MTAVRWALALLLLVSGLGVTRAEEPQPAAVLAAFAASSDAGAFEARLEFVGAPRANVLVLADPNRVVVDLFDTVAAAKDFSVASNPLVRSLRHGLATRDRFRLVFELKQPAVPQMATNAADGKTVLRLRLAAADAASFRAAVAARGRAVEPPAPAASEPASEAAPSFTVVIDPGHGGIDTGAIGPNGTLEKDVNLRFAAALRDALGLDPRVHVLMTRSDDTFVSLGERSAIARRAKADLFVSTHSDSIRFRDLRGATVYTLSEKASDSLSREVAESENAADRFVDPAWRDRQPEVADILVELMRRETDSRSEHFAAALVAELERRGIRLIRNPKRSAGFMVLKAPDVPSVLVEIGYLSNPDEEKLLQDDAWRTDTAKAVAVAILGFLGAGTGEAAAAR